VTLNIEVLKKIMAIRHLLRCFFIGKLDMRTKKS
jgi:hypothetical protein